MTFSSQVNKKEYDKNPVSKFWVLSVHLH